MEQERVLCEQKELLERRTGEAEERRRGAEEQVRVGQRERRIAFQFLGNTLD